MSDTPNHAAETALVAALAAAIPWAKVMTEPDKLSKNGSSVIVGSAGATWTENRWLVELSVDAFAPGSTPKARERKATEMGDAVLSGFRTLDGADVFWAGPGSELGSEPPSDVEIDGATYGMISASGTVCVEIPGRYGSRGPAEQAVADLLVAAGIPVAETADRGEFVIVRWTGSAPEDPYTEQVMVVCAAPADTGAIEALSRRTWRALFDADGFVVSSDVSADPAGSPPGSVLTHSVSQMFVQCLTQTRRD